MAQGHTLAQAVRSERQVVHGDGRDAKSWLQPGAEAALTARVPPLVVILPAQYQRRPGITPSPHDGAARPMRDPVVQDAKGGAAA